MQIGEYELAVDSTTKFFSTVFVSGWINGPATLRSVTLNTTEKLGEISEVGLDHGGVVHTLGPGKGFRVQALRKIASFDWNAEIIFRHDEGQIVVKLRDLLQEANDRQAGLIDRTLKAIVDGPDVYRVLDVGGRDRSGNDYSKLFPNKNVTVLDIMPGNNVHVVGDAHELSNLFPSDHFDLIYSVSVFEHLLQPWKVAIEMNRVLRRGGIVFVHTHQTIAMHDMPWDFLRFSSDSWSAFFNQYTGFEILQTSSRHPQYVLPYSFRQGKEDAEMSAGFESSTVIARKICESSDSIRWDVPINEIIQTEYPTD